MPTAPAAHDSLALSCENRAVLPKGTRIGPYEIVDDLGSGGMGHVHLARDSRLGRTVALKTLREDFPDRFEAVARFRNEARAASALNHPSIVHIYDIDEETPRLPDGLPAREQVLYIAMEHVRGETLRERLKTSQADRSQLVHWICQVADGIAKAHEAGILHRDLKPENIMISEDGFAKILDFGLAKLTEAHLGEVDGNTPTAPLPTTEGFVYGTAPYMAPEQLCGGKPSPSADLFAIGCILYEALVGEHPFQRRSTVETIHAIVYEQPLPPSRRGISIAPRLEKVVMCCLQKAPEKRYATARELANDLREAALDAPAKPKRLGGVLPLAAAAAAILILAIGAVSLFMRRDNRAAPSPAISAPTDSVGTIAVLPFDNSDPSTEYLSDGISEAIMYDLSRSRSLRVIPRTSAFRFKAKGVAPADAGRQLGADAVVAGEVRQEGNSLVVRAELIDVDSGSMLWGRRMEKSASEIVAVQHEIAREIRQSLQRDPLPSTKTTADPEAYRLYLRGRYFWNKRTADGLERASDHFRQALDKDPTFALAWVGLGDSYALLEQYAGIPSAENCAKAKQAIVRAQEFDPSLAQAHATLGLLYGHCEWDWTRSEESFSRAIELDPNYATAHHWFALHLSYRSLFERGLAEAGRAQELDPLSLIAGNAASVVQAYARNWPAVIAQSDRLLEMDEGFAVAHMWRGRALRATGRHDEAIAEMGRALELSGGKSLEMLGELGSCYALAGKRAEALTVVGQLEEEDRRGRTAAYPLAAVHASLGDKTTALRWLDQAFNDGSWFLVQLGVEPLFDPLREDARFKEMVLRVGVGDR
jgi:serine/threonine protein kinase/tetratricopeptide (TPR) repeat protein